MKKRNETIRFSISLPSKLLHEMDKRTIAKGYASRSEYVRDLIRAQMIGTAWNDKTATVVGILTIVFDHHQKNLAYQITEAQHRKHLNILCSTHVHLDHHHCLETIHIKGLPEEIEKLAIDIGGLKGVEFAELTKAAVT